MSNFNKVVTNIPVSLTETEMSNLSQTLSGIIQGGGGGGEGKRYIGDGVYVTVNNDANPGIIALTQTSLEKLNREIPSAVSSFPDSIQYAKKTYVDNTFQTKDAMSAYWTSAETNAAFEEELSTLVGLINGKQDILKFSYDNDKISAINGSALAGQGGGTGNYSAGIDLKIENNTISVNTNGNPNNTASNTRNFVEGSWTEASGYNTHAEGMATTAYGYAVHAQGMWTKFSSSKWSDDQHQPVDIYWAPGAGATVEGYCNATTSCPMSGTVGQSDYGPIHGGVLKVIGNGNVVHDTSVDPDAHVHELQPSDALIIFKDGTISAFGDIYNNGKKYVTEDSISSYNITAQQGVEVTPTYDSTNKTITFGISITSTPVVTDTTLSGYNGIAAAKDGDVSGQWNVGLTNDMLNTINGKLNASDFNTYTATTAPSTYQPIGNYLSANALTNYYTKSETSGATEISTALGNKVDKPDTSLKNNYLALRTNNDGSVSGWVDILDKVYSKTAADGRYQKITDMGSYLTTAQYETDSATFYPTSNPDGYLTKTVADTYYQPLGNYATSAGLTAGKQYAMTTNGWAEVQGGTSFTGVVTGTGLSGTGLSNSPLGIDTNAAIYLTNGSAKSATSALSANKAGSAISAKWLRDDNASVSASDVTALQNWASSNSSTWDNVSAKLATAQYANDSATFVTSSISTITETKQYALTTTGWSSVETAYLPLSGGTVSGQLEVHGGSNFDQQFIKLTREGNTCGARIGLGSDTTNGTLALKTFNTQGQNTVQVNIKHNTNNNELIQVQKDGNTLGNLIPAVISTTTAGLTDDGILHIIIES